MIFGSVSRSQTLYMTEITKTFFCDSWWLTGRASNPDLQRRHKPQRCHTYWFVCVSGYDGLVKHPPRDINFELLARKTFWRRTRNRTSTIAIAEAYYAQTLVFLKTLTASDNYSFPTCDPSWLAKVISWNRWYAQCTQIKHNNSLVTCYLLLPGL